MLTGVVAFLPVNDLFWKMRMLSAKNTWSAVKWAIVVGVLLLLYFVLKDIGFAEILQAMGLVPVRVIVVSAALVLAMYLLWSFRLQLMMPPETRGSILAVFPIYMSGIFGNIITPGARVGGEPIRAYYMGQVFGGAKSGHFGVLLADKFGNMSVYFIYLMVALSFMVVFVPVPLWLKVFLWAVVFLILGAVVSGVLMREHIGAESRFMSWVLRFLYDEPILRYVRKRFESYQHFEDYVIDKLDNIFGPVFRAVKSPIALLKLFSISFFSWLLFYLAHYILFRSLGARATFFQVFIIVSVSNFCGDISFAPGGTGIMETAMIAMCAAFGLDYSTAAAVTLISRGVYYVTGLGVGGCCFGVLSIFYGRTPVRAQSGSETGQDDSPAKL
ncbi:MAG: lysylphosphatidylglycerol synthase transmembrane domain-containing protein [Planctomycetota bacterium]